MNKYYIQDTTINKEVQFNTYNEVIKHLEGTCQRKFKQSRKDYMNDMQSLGHSEDGRDGTSFCRLMAEQFNIGVIREHGKMRTDITTVERYNKPEFGD